MGSRFGGPQPIASRSANRMNRNMYLEKFRLGGRVAVVTGGGQGIGLACAEALGEAGARIVIADRDPEGCRDRLRPAQGDGL